MLNQNFQISWFRAVFPPFMFRGRGFTLPDTISVRSARHPPASEKKELSVQTILARHPLIEIFLSLLSDIPVPGRTDGK